MESQQSALANQKVLFENFQDTSSFADFILEQRLFWFGHTIGSWHSGGVQEIFTHLIDRLVRSLSLPDVTLNDVFERFDEHEHGPFWLLIVFWFFEKRRLHQMSVSGNVTLSFPLFAFFLISWRRYI